jgi:hypothetical protein
MFDDVFGLVERCMETFRSGVRDAFGASIIADVLDPIRDHIRLLRSFHEESQRLSLAVEQVLEDARSITLAEGSQR